jgi:hypothetical protein
VSMQTSDSPGADRTRVNLSIFVNEDRTEVPCIAKSGTVVTLRKSTKNLVQTQSTAVDALETGAPMESYKTSLETLLTYADLAVDGGEHPAEKDIPTNLKPSQDQQEQASMGTSMPDTQEKMQLAAIATMVRQSACINFQAPHVIRRLSCVQTVKACTIHKSLT